MTVALGWKPERPPKNNMAENGGGRKEVSWLEHMEHGATCKCRETTVDEGCVPPGTERINVRLRCLNLSNGPGHAEVKVKCHNQLGQ